MADEFGCPKCGTIPMGAVSTTGGGSAGYIDSPAPRTPPLPVRELTTCTVCGSKLHREQADPPKPWELAP